MNADERRLELNRVTEMIIGCAFQVGNTLGVGFLERVYENALVHELGKTGLRVEQQKPLQVWYDGIVVGNYEADLLVEEAVIVELKAVTALDSRHFAQCMNYLKATRLTLGLIINFGNPKVEVKRVVRNF
ncbi:GxxExxY protein [Scytonema hofmannii FACHB-248]|uniref:GxxExxY protein n=1 Tax=Scytonema hofmannii FACHB-248 TaxID=1842502 RepID=A0ABR8GSG2_9CYAN|nr:MULTISPECIES: GxxExxY protein [Nostocales]MBD2606068.1 GxxExxY protein [Scytonema hofmannii FACHB-248]